MTRCTHPNCIIEVLTFYDHVITFIDYEVESSEDSCNVFVTKYAVTCEDCGMCKVYKPDKIPGWLQRFLDRHDKYLNNCGLRYKDD